jgi:hypothetical protein
MGATSGTPPAEKCCVIKPKMQCAWRTELIKNLMTNVNLNQMFNFSHDKAKIEFVD